MQVKDIIEIKPAQSGHAPGLVVVLDTLVTHDPAWLVGAEATVRTPDGNELRMTIDEAREHNTANSLFFRNLNRSAIPIGCEITITIPMESLAPNKAPALAS